MSPNLDPGVWVCYTLGYNIATILHILDILDSRVLYTLPQDGEALGGGILGGIYHIIRIPTCTTSHDVYIFTCTHMYRTPGHGE